MLPVAAVFLVVSWVGVCHVDPSVRLAAQEPGRDVIADASEIESVLSDQPDVEETAESENLASIDLLSLITRGGGFMIPIGIMSFLVVTLAVERFASLRRGKIMPPQLVRELDDEADPIEHFHPSVAFEHCEKHPSPLGRVVRSMLLRTGGPLADIERTASETIQREADQCAAPIRWLNLAAAATPLMGLLGTVWGMIVAFHESTTLTADRSRSEQLSEGIYTALVTTLAGLVVAIPAAILAQYLENRVASLFHRIEQFAFELAPALERFEGQKRLRSDGTLHPAPTPPPAPPPRTAGASKTSSASNHDANPGKKGKRGGAKAS